MVQRGLDRITITWATVGDRGSPGGRGLPRGGVLRCRAADRGRGQGEFKGAKRIVVVDVTGLGPQQPDGSWKVPFRWKLRHPILWWKMRHEGIRIAG